MVKEFIINGRKVMIVECDISTKVCPATKMMLNSKDVDLCNISELSDGCAVVEAQAKKASQMNRAIVERCYKCRVRDFKMETKQVQFAIGYFGDVLHVCHNCSALRIENNCPVRYGLQSGSCLGVTLDDMDMPEFRNRYRYLCAGHDERISSIEKCKNEIKEIAKVCKYNAGR